MATQDKAQHFALYEMEGAHWREIQDRLEFLPGEFGCRNDGHVVSFQLTNSETPSRKIEVNVVLAAQKGKAR